MEQSASVHLSGVLGLVDHVWSRVFLDRRNPGIVRPNTEVFAERWCKQTELFCAVAEDLCMTKMTTEKSWAYGMTSRREKLESPWRTQLSPSFASAAAAAGRYAQTCLQRR